jgi:hypothetical protein
MSSRFAVKWDDGIMKNSESWYYCLKHRRAERGMQCPGEDRLGPYPDEATANRALAIVRERERIKEAEDRDWSGDD